MYSWCFAAVGIFKQVFYLEYKYRAADKITTYSSATSDAVNGNGLVLRMIRGYIFNL